MLPARKDEGMSTRPPHDPWPTREDTLVRPPEETAVTRAPPPDEPDRRFAWGLLVGILLVALGAAAVAAVWLLTRDDPKAVRATPPTPATRPTTTAPAATTAVRVAVPRLIGLKEQRALVRLGEVGLRPKEIYRPTKKPKNVVVSQRPREATEVARGSRVTLVIDSGAPKVAVPDVTGEQVAVATAKLDALGLDSTQTLVTSSRPVGTVVDQAPPAGTKAAKGSLVTLSVAKAAPEPIPGLVGKDQAAAVAALRAAGYEVSTATVPSDAPKGQVVAQSPAAGTNAKPRSSVRINISDGAKSTTAATTTATTTGATTAAATTTAAPKTVSVPDLTNAQLQAAVHRLAATGLLASVQYIPGDDPLETVLHQAPASGQPARQRSHVTLNVSSGPGQKEQKTVPDVVGQTLDQSLATINSAGLRLIFAKLPITDRTRAGKIVEQTPAAGKTAPQNAQVLVYLGAFRS
jgi:beta-lactam-binding protein with PASTA domain